MSKTLTFKPEFEAKLKQLKIKTKFVNNCKKVKWPEHQAIRIKECFNTTNNWLHFIVYAFHWDSTPEGYDYWFKIARK